MPDDEGLREELAEALQACDEEAGSPPWQLLNETFRTDYRRMAAAALPVIERYAAERAAEALRRVEAIPAVGTLQGAPVVALADLRRALAADGTEPRPAHRQDETEAGRG